MTDRSAFLLAWAAWLVLAGLTASPSAQELMTLDRIGTAEAPNSMTLRISPDRSHANPIPSHAEHYAKLYQSFAEAHPDWQIQVELMTTNIGQEHARMLEQARAQRAPDCAAVDSFQLPLFIAQGVLQPVTRHFAQDEIDDLFPFIRKGMTGPDGEIYAWWWYTDLRVLYRNTTLVPDAPQTWKELKAAATKATEAGVYGVLFNGGRWEGTTFDWLAHFWSQGGSLLDEQGRPVFAESENRAYMLNAINLYKDLVDSGAAPRRVTTISTYDELNAAAIAGTTAMFQGGQWQYFQLREAMPEAEFANWDVSELPGPTPEQRATGTGGWSIAAFSSDPEKVELCMDLIRQVYMSPINEVQGQLPTRQSLFDTLPAFNTPLFAKFRQYLVHGQARPGFPIYPEVSNQIQIMLGEVLSRTKKPEAALDDAAARVMDAYRKL